MIAWDYLVERGLVPEIHGDRLLVSPASELTDDDRAFIRSRKAEILAQLTRRRHRDQVLMTLADNPGVKYAFTVETGGDPIILAVAIRNMATFEMTIPADRYDPFKLLELFDNGPVQTV